MCADVCALEVGLGGLKDPTNIIDPLVAVIATIDLDHMDMLGPTVREIAYNKAGIIKPNRPTVVGPHCTPLDVFTQKAREQKSELI